MSFWAILIIFAVAVVAIGVASVIHTSSGLKELGTAISNIPRFSASFQYLGADGGNGIAVDETRSKVCLFKRESKTLTHRVFDYRDVLSCELFEDGQTMVKTSRSSLAVRALVGGMLLGNVGAFVGGMSAKKVESGKVSKIGLRLVLNDSVQPIHEIFFLSVKSKRNGLLYKNSSEQAKKWQARLDGVIKRANRDDASSHVASQEDKQNLSDELRKLAELRDRGILTGAEFAAQKAKLLGWKIHSG
ncbi:MAG: SHOCT domain-containing protein [Burkholderiaceae bacterium]|nr:MAG: SHOCT domain-containing protein [Burkholderiaceae bacterium]